MRTFLFLVTLGLRRLCAFDGAGIFFVSVDECEAIYPSTLWAQNVADHLTDRTLPSALALPYALRHFAGPSVSTSLAQWKGTEVYP